MANKLLINERYIEIVCDRTDTATHELVSQIPYIHANRINTSFKTTIRNIDLVLKLFRNIDASNIQQAPEPIKVIFNREMKRRSATKTLLEEGPKKAKGWLFTHQQLGREIAEVNNRFGFFYDTRTGKTPMSLQIIVDDIQANPTHKWLVLCPLILIENAWLEDAKHFFPDLKVINLHDTSKSVRLKRFTENGQLYLSNIESFISYREHIEKLNIHGCFVDESSTMKSHSSKFGKAAVEYAQTLKQWYLLSGTPAPNGEWEYYRQLQSIDFYGVHDSWTKFKLYFFNNVSHNPQFEKLQVKPERKAELLKLLREYSLYVDKEDVLTTPGREFIPVEIELPVALKDNYKQLRDELYLELKDETLITTPSAAAKLNKLNQVTSGFIIDTAAIKRNRMRIENNMTEPLENESHFLSDYRFVELDKLLYNIGNKQVLIWCIYKKEFEILKQRLGDKCACVYGDVNITDKNLNIKAFKDGKVQYLIANPASADKGLTLTNAHFAIYFSLGYSYELYKQSIERIYGDIVKQKNRCTYYILIAKGTVDRAIYTTLQNKGDMSMAILNHLKGGEL